MSSAEMSTPKCAACSKSRIFVLMTDGDTASGSHCAACKKETDNHCTGCGFSKYCDSRCQEAHRPRHEKYVELFEEQLFQTPPQKEDCAICCLPLPMVRMDQIKYQPCCGKTLCGGCAYADVIAKSSPKQKKAVDLICPFCRQSNASPSQNLVNLKKRVEAKDPIGMFAMANKCANGDGVPKDTKKAIVLLDESGRLGCAEAHNKLGEAYFKGEYGEINISMGIYYLERSAIGGNAFSRHMLGLIELESYIGGTVNWDRARRHFMISAGAGMDDSLEKIKGGFKEGHISKDEFARALRSHQKAKDEVRSEQRDDALHFSENNMYVGQCICAKKSCARR